MMSAMDIRQAEVGTLAVYLLFWWHEGLWLGSLEGHSASHKTISIFLERDLLRVSNSLVSSVRKWVLLDCLQ